MTLIPHIVDGHTIEQRTADGYLNATAMCKATGKLFADYSRLASVREFLTELESVMGIPITELTQSLRGGNEREQGTWVHPKVAIHLAQWLSPRFAVQVVTWVEEWMTNGKVAIPLNPTPEPVTVKPEPAPDRYLERLLSHMETTARQSQIREDRLFSLLESIESKRAPRTATPVPVREPTFDDCVAEGRSVSLTQAAEHFGIVFSTGRGDAERLCEILVLHGWLKGKPQNWTIAPAFGTTGKGYLELQPVTQHHWKNQILVTPTGLTAMEADVIVPERENPTRVLSPGVGVERFPAINRYFNPNP